MGIKSKPDPSRGRSSFGAVLRLFRAVLLAWAGLAQLGSGAQSMPTQAITVPLILPGGLAYDASGNLFFAETANHRVRRVSAAGVLTTVAGMGVQGFGGDGGPAVSALLDSPTAIVLDPAGNLLISDSHNHRIRRVDATTAIITTIAGTGSPGQSANGTLAAAAQLDLPVALALDASQNLFFADARTHLVRRIDHVTSAVTTVAGNGTQGFSGDGGPAIKGSIDTPTGLALDVSGNLYLSDTHNQRVRRVDAVTGMITSVAGTGQPGFSGDGGSSTSAALRLPRGITLDSAGNLYLADSSNHRIRRIDAASGAITTLAGDGTQGYAGDGGPAMAASLDSPRAVTLSPAALPTLSDTANQRIRQVDSAALIHTIAGLGATTAGTLALAAPNVVLYGTGTVTATLAASPATGLVTFFDTFASTMQTVAAKPLAANTATLPITTMFAGPHHISATYSGDNLHAAAQSGVLSLAIAPVTLSVAPASFNLLYGQPLPALTGNLEGLLPQDSAAVSLVLSSTAAALAAPAVYPITGSLSGSRAGNYTLAAAPAAITIAKAPSLTTLTSALAVHVASSTAGSATGVVTLLDGATPYTLAPLSVAGNAAFSSANLSLGTHTLTAIYAGDGNLLASTSAPTIVTIGSAATPDFTLAATGQTTVTVPAGTPAAFSFAVNPVNGALSSPILLTASGLPLGATASFNPAYLPQSNTPAAFILTIQTPKTAMLAPLFQMHTVIYAAMLPFLYMAIRRRRVASLVATVLVLCVLGCGDRIAPTNATSATTRTYNITVIATATSAAGGTLQHTAAVTLILQ